MSNYFDPSYGGASILKGLIPSREEVAAAEPAKAGRDFLARCTARSQLLATTALAQVA